MKKIIRLFSITLLAGSAMIATSAQAFWGPFDFFDNDDDYWGGPWGYPGYGYPGYGYGGYPGYGYGGYPGYGYGGYPGYGYRGYPGYGYPAYPQYAPQPAPAAPAK